VTLNAHPYCRTLTCVMPVIFTFSLQANVKCLVSSASKIWPGPQNVEMGHVTLTAPIWRKLAIRRLILHVANSCTKFEVSSCSRCRDISEGVKF